MVGGNWLHTQPSIDPIRPIEYKSSKIFYIHRNFCNTKISIDIVLKSLYTRKKERHLINIYEIVRLKRDRLRKERPLGGQWAVVILTNILFNVKGLLLTRKTVPISNMGN